MWSSPRACAPLVCFWVENAGVLMLHGFADKSGWILSALVAAVK